VRAHFSDGTFEDGELLVAADGLHSRVRRQYLPKQVILDTTGRAIYGKTVITPELLEKFSKAAMETTSVISSPTENGVPLTLFTEAIRFEIDPALVSEGVPSVQDYVYWVLLSRDSTFALSDVEFMSLNQQQARELSLSVTQTWIPALRAVLELQSPEHTSIVRISTALPNIESWPASHVTLLGDAIHVMPPTGGVGGSTAMRDGGVLCEIIENGISVENIAKYEEKMRIYSGEAILASARGGKALFGQPDFSDLKPLYPA